ncbi:hypothetical protein PG984_011337 [Apiospora sp. TS-2023a]
MNMLLQGHHLELGRNSNKHLKLLSHKARDRLARSLLGGRRRFDRIKEIEKPDSLLGEVTPTLFCLGIWQADEAIYPRALGPHPRSEAVPSQENGGANEQYRLFREFQEYLLKLMEQSMSQGSISIPMRALVFTACPGHFVTTFVDSSGKREDVLVGWPDDQDCQKDQKSQEDLMLADQWQEMTTTVSK